MRKKTSQREKLESQFLSITGVLVFLIGGPAFLTIIKEPSVQAVSSKNTNSRSVASISSQEVVSANTVSSISSESNHEEVIHPPAISASNTLATIQYDCESEEKQSSVEGQYIRLKGNSCKDAADLTITNKTNGFSATVFFSKDKKFTTDYIDLKDGLNDLEITLSKNDGTKVLKNMKINRRVPASISN